MTGNEQRFWRRVALAAHTYGVLFIMATTGFITTNFAKVFAGFLASEERFPFWCSAAWHGGTLIGLIGAMMGWIRFENGFEEVARSQPEPEDETVSAEQASTGQDSAAAESLLPKLTPKERIGNGLLFAAVVGAIGTIFGCSLLVFWFWFTAGPYAPHDWIASVQVRKESLPGDSTRSIVHTTAHPIALALVWVPGLVGLLSGVVIGVVGNWRTTFSGSNRSDG